MPSDPVQDLVHLRPERPFFIGIDSDGCAFDTMEIKHKECFCPATIRHFGLQPVSRYAREAWEFVNLYSKQRGVNRFPALVAVLDLLRERPEVRARGADVPVLPRLRAWIASESRLGNPALKRLVAETGDDELRRVLAWSEAVNAAISDMVYGVPPFPLVRESLARAAQHADLVVVSQTPVEALHREWEEHHLADRLRFIAGQEHGTKSEHLRHAAAGKYPPERILMIGDAYGDLTAAQSIGALFFPILPGREDASWQHFYDEGLPRFLDGTFAGAYQEGLVRQLADALPDTPFWHL